MPTPASSWAANTAGRGSWRFDGSDALFVSGQGMERLPAFGWECASRDMSSRESQVLPGFCEVAFLCACGMICLCCHSTVCSCHSSFRSMSERHHATRAMRLSLAAGFLMLVLKGGAFVLTHSAAILGDAAESIVHVAAVAFAAFSLGLRHKPADKEHPYGHTKIAFFSAGVEGALIVMAALFITYEAVHRWLKHLPPQHLDAGLGLTALTIVINGALGVYLLRTGRRVGSVILQANGRHVLTDVWTSLGAIAGLGLVALTGWYGWDPICGVLMAGNIIWTGYGLMRQSVGGLMDTADPQFQNALKAAFRQETERRGIQFHALRHRDAGEMYYVEVHLLFADDILLRDAHRAATEIERAVQAQVDRPVLITTHLECLGDHDELHSHGEASDPNSHSHLA